MPGQMTGDVLAVPVFKRYTKKIPYRKIDAFVRASLYCRDRQELPRGGEAGRNDEAYALQYEGEDFE